MVGSARIGQRGVQGLFGVALILAGAALVGNGVYTFVVTDAIAAAAQEDLADEFAVRLEQGPTASDIGSAVAADNRFLAGEDEPIMLGTVPDAPELPAPIEWARESAPAVGGAVAQLWIPAIGYDGIVVEGVEPEQLRAGPGHMPETPLPGQPGNTVLSGHRSTNGSPFGALDDLEPGDEIMLLTTTGMHRYAVRSSLVVAPNEMWVTAQHPGAWLTLTTCHPRGSSRERLIVFAELTEGVNVGPVVEMFGDVDIPTPPPGSLAFEDAPQGVFGDVATADDDDGR